MNMEVLLEDLYFELNGTRGLITTKTLNGILFKLKEDRQSIRDNVSTRYEDLIIDSSNSENTSKLNNELFWLNSELDFTEKLINIFDNLSRAIEHSYERYEERTIVSIIDEADKSEDELIKCFLNALASIFCDRFLIKNIFIIDELLNYFSQDLSKPESSIEFLGDISEPTSNQSSIISIIIKNENARLYFLKIKNKFTDTATKVTLDEVYQDIEKTHAIVSPETRKYCKKLILLAIYDKYDVLLETINDSIFDKNIELYLEIKRLKDEEKDWLELKSMTKKVDNQIANLYIKRNLFSLLCHLMKGQKDFENNLMLRNLKELYFQLKESEEKDKNYFIFFKLVDLFNHFGYELLNRSNLLEFLDEQIQDCIANLRKFSKYTNNSTDSLILACDFFLHGKRENNKLINANGTEVEIDFVIHSGFLLPGDYEHFYNLEIIPEINKAELLLNSIRLKKEVYTKIDINDKTIESLKSEVKTNKIDTVTILGIFAGLVLTASAGSKLFEKSNISFEEYVLIFGAFSVMLTSFISLLYSVLNWNRSAPWLRIISSLPLLSLLAFGLITYKYERPTLKKLELKVDSLQKAVHQSIVVDSTSQKDSLSQKRP